MTVPPIISNNVHEDNQIINRNNNMNNHLNNIYHKKYELLLERCEILQQDNERIVHRIYQVKKMTKRFKKEIKFLMNRLDMHGDHFRNIQIEEEDVKPNIANVNQLSGFVVPKTEKGSMQSSSRSMVDKNSGKKAPAKRKATRTEKAEKDPNAPKKPCNAFFQFCQEQRPIILAEGCSDGSGTEPSKQEVTRQLASRWRALSSEDKKVYVAMFERSKEKYAEEMSAYIKKE